jgi:hypothetical protein
MASRSWFKKKGSFYTDATGVIHRSMGAEPASSTTPVINNVSSILRSIANCLIQNGPQYPSDVQHFPDDAKLVCSRQFMKNGLQYQTYGTEVSYVPTLDHDRVTGFALTARPKDYGKGGVRSYLVDETGVVHTTSDNRAASASDPPVSACEYYTEFYSDACPGAPAARR